MLRFALQLHPGLVSSQQYMHLDMHPALQGSFQRVCSHTSTHSSRQSVLTGPC
jgi:hypothetical protein